MRMRDALNTKGSLLGLSGLVVSAFAVAALVASPAQSVATSATGTTTTAAPAAGHGAADHHAAGGAASVAAASVGSTAVKAAARLPKVGGPNVAIPRTGAKRTSDGVKRPVMPAGSKTTVTSIGPLLVAGGSVGKPGTVPGTEAYGGNAPTVDIDKPCTDCYLLGIKAKVTDELGQVVDLPQKAMLHHIVLGRQGGGLKDMTCDQQIGGATLGQRFFASGNELTDIRMPAGYGIYVGNSEVWSSFTHLMNWSAEPRLLSVKLTFSWIPRLSAPGTMKTATPVWLDAAACNPFDTFELPSTGRVQAQSATWTSPINGRIIGAGGHLHSDGIVLRSVNATTGKTICNSWSREFRAPGWTDGHGMDGVSVMTRCYQKDPAHPIGVIRRGDTIRTTAYYNRMNDKKDPYEYLMGIMVAFVVPTT